jgi:hypothetical protein
LTAPERDEGKTYWRMSSKPKASEPNVLVEVDDPNFKIAKDGYVVVYATVTGEFEAQSALGRTINGVAARATTAFSRNGPGRAKYVDAFPPALAPAARIEQ